MQPGQLGALLWRLPGSAHSLFGTGAIISYVLPELLTDLGRRWLQQRMGPNAAGMPGTNLLGWLDNWHLGSPVRPADTLYHYQASHVQCLPRLHDASGRPLPVRWHFGGQAPATRVVGTIPDYLEAQQPGDVWRGLSWPIIRKFLHDSTGRRLDEMAPEFPFGTGMQVNGPPPGAFLVNQ